MNDFANQAPSDARQYLMETLSPVLIQGLEALCRDRPENPVDALAMYLLKRTPNRNIAVEVPISATVPDPPARAA